jgi:hypothetical protein
MSRTVKLTIRARGESDSPTVEDLLDQLRDYFAILEGVEEAISDDGRQAIEWRIVKATSNTPLMFEAAAFPRDYGVNIDRRVETVTKHTALGLNQLNSGSGRPSYFTDKVLARAESFFERVTNGLVQTTVEYGGGLPTLDVTTQGAHVAAKNVHSVLHPPVKPYNEIGSIEGFAKAIDTDGYGRQLLLVKHRLTGEVVKCIAHGDALKELEAHRIGDVWHGRRVQVYGTLQFKGLGELSQIDATKIRFLRERAELPDVDDILDERFTGGLRSEVYLERIRYGKTS